MKNIGLSFDKKTFCESMDRFTGRRSKSELVCKLNSIKHQTNLIIRISVSKDIYFSIIFLECGILVS